jgi:hypothetical protein
MACTSIAVGFVTCFLSIIAICVSLYVFCKSRREKSYADLDSLYLELLKLAIKYPKFINPRYTLDYDNAFRDEDSLYRYKAYAYIAWNICETIYDRRDDILFETWKAVIVNENKLHRKWFDNPENYHKFKDRFREYIQSNFPQEYMPKSDCE